MNPEDTQQGLFPKALPPARPAASPQQLADLLVRLKLRRRELLDAYAVSFESDELISPSAMQPLATIQQAIVAVKAELVETGP